MVHASRNSLATAVLLVLSFFHLLGAESGWSAPSSLGARARAEYIRLRNVDPTGKNHIYRKEWEVLAAGFRGILTSKGSESEKLRLRVISADTHLRLYRATKQRSYLMAASDSLNPLVAPGTTDLPAEMASEVYLLMGDIQVSGGGISDAASSWYRKSIEAGGSAARVAQQRLMGISNGTFSRLIPSSDIESPRLLRDSESLFRRGNAPILVIDPGHGGADAGALGSMGEQEKEITLDVARRVKTILEMRHGYRVYLTRESDIFVPLARRTAFANRKGAATFVSLHVNASAGHDADGLEAYYLDNTNDEASRKLAERENGIAHGESLDDLSFMLGDLIQSGKLEDSIILTRSIEGALKQKIVKHGKGVRSLGVKKGPFFVLVGAHMPCSLIEMFFIDHPHDGRLLGQDHFRSALATGIADGIRSFLGRTTGSVTALPKKH